MYRNHRDESRVHECVVEGSARPLPDCDRNVSSSNRHANREKDSEDQNLKCRSSQWSVVRRSNRNRPRPITADYLPIIPLMPTEGNGLLTTDYLLNADKRPCSY